MNLLTGIESSSAALNAERLRMEIVSQNIANANTTRTEKGGPYQRQQILFTSELDRELGQAIGLEGGARLPVVSRIMTDKSEPKLIYKPGHPDADGDGMVAMPNVNVHEEMVDLMTAMRAFEANLAAIKSARTMATQTLSIGK